MWKAHQEAMRDRTQLDDYHDPQLDPPRLNHAIEEVRRTTAPVETHGPAGTVVLWVRKLSSSSFFKDLTSMNGHGM